MAALDYDYFEQQYASALSGNKSAEEEEEKAKKGSRLNLNPDVRTSAILFAVIAAVFVMAIANIFGFAKINDINREYSEKQEIYNTNSSRIKELEAGLEALVSPEKIEKTAIEKLGLIKLDDSDWQYISINENNKVIIADGHIE